MIRLLDKRSCATRFLLKVRLLSLDKFISTKVLVGLIIKHVVFYQLRLVSHKVSIRLSLFRLEFQ